MQAQQTTSTSRLDKRSATALSSVMDDQLSVQEAALLLSALAAVLTVAFAPFVL